MNNQGKVWYFAYGSNLNRDRLYCRIKKWEDEKRAILKDFRLTFDSRGKADIISESDDQVYGAAYCITMEQLDDLDDCEGVQSGVYQRKPVVVDCDAGKQEAVTYQKVSPSRFEKPADWYLELILTGLEEHGWGRDVIEAVKRIASRSI